MRIALLATAVIAATALVGCDAVRYNTLEDGFVSQSRVTEVSIDNGEHGSGNVTVRGDDTVTGVTVSRKVRYRGSEPGSTIQTNASTLHLDMDCGPNCSVSYDVRLPRGVNVHGGTDSGDLTLQGVGQADVHVDSGNITFDGVSGPASATADSGNITVASIEGDLIAETSSGNIDARDLHKGARLKADSGNITLVFAGTGDVAAQADSGNIDITLPDGVCSIQANSSSGSVHTESASASSASVSCHLTASTDSGWVSVRPSA